MGKVKRSRGSKLELEKAKRQTPLSNQILEDDSVRPTGRTKQRQRTEDDDEVYMAMCPIIDHLFETQATVPVTVSVSDSE